MRGDGDWNEILIVLWVVLSDLLQEQLVGEVELGPRSVEVVEHDPEDEKEEEDAAADNAQQPVQLIVEPDCHLHAVGDREGGLHAAGGRALHVLRLCALVVAAPAHHTHILVVAPGQDGVVHQSDPHARSDVEVGADGVRSDVDLRGVGAVHVEPQRPIGQDVLGSEVKLYVVIGENVRIHLLRGGLHKDRCWEGIGDQRRHDGEVHIRIGEVGVSGVVLHVVRDHQAVLQQLAVDVVDEVLPVAGLQGLVVEHVGVVGGVNKGLEVAEQRAVVVDSPALLVPEHYGQLEVVLGVEGVREVYVRVVHGLIIVPFEVADGCGDVEAQAEGEEQEGGEAAEPGGSPAVERVVRRESVQRLEQ